MDDDNTEYEYELDADTHAIMCAIHAILGPVADIQATDEAAELIDGIRLIIAQRFNLPEQTFPEPEKNLPPVVTINGKPHLRLVPDNDDE